MGRGKGWRHANICSDLAGLSLQPVSAALSTGNLQLIEAAAAELPKVSLSVEAVHGDREDAVPDGRVDHRWIRVRDPQASRRFYTTIAPHAGLRLAHDEPGRVQLSGPDYSFSLVRDERPLTEHVHLASPAREDAAVRAFHAAALAAGYADHGAPGERAMYHPGYYGAFMLDPDGHNIEVVNHNRG